MACERINIGEFKSCGGLLLPFSAKKSGIHTIQYKINGAIHIIRVPSLINNRFHVNLEKFHVNREITFEIYDPDGELYIIDTYNEGLPCDESELEGCFYKFGIKVFPAYEPLCVYDIKDIVFQTLKASNLDPSKVNLLDFYKEKCPS